MKKSSLRKRSLSSFTMVELLVVMGIIALMAGLLQPAFLNSIHKAQSIQCAGNLRSIGIAASLAAADNNNLYPNINQVASSTPAVYPPGTPGLVGVLGPYGITPNVVICPVDKARGASADCTNMTYANPGSSYEWNPVFDDENPNVLVVYGGTRNGTAPFPVNSSRVRLCYDYTGVHTSHVTGAGVRYNARNVLYGDGRVTFSTH